MTAGAPSATALHDRTHAFAALFTHIAQTRMDGIPVLNLMLRVEAVGFEAVTLELPTECATESETNSAPIDPMAGAGAVGILITPWFMNLVWLPLVQVNFERCTGINRMRNVGTENFSFIGGFEASFGSYEACSLFSPMFEFPDHDAARETAQAVLAALRQPVPAPPALPAAPQVDIPARRAFMFGRRPTVAGAV